MKKSVFNQLLKWFLPILFIFFINGKMFFTHSHFIHDSIVVHSHPFQKSENTNHNHTTKELIAIEFHTHGISTDAIAPHFEINSPIRFSTPHNFFYEKNVLFLQKTNTNLLRAPPISLVV